MNDTRSRKRTDTSRRSVEVGAVAGEVTGATEAPIALPHSPQNLLSGGFGAPHVGHPGASDAPHSIQNLRAASFSVPQAAQLMPIPDLA